MYTCVRGIELVSLSTTFHLDFGTVLKVFHLITHTVITQKISRGLPICYTLKCFCIINWISTI